MRKKGFLILAILWTLIVVILSLASFSSMPKAAVKVPYVDKFVHFTFYAVFVYLWAKLLFYNMQTRFAIYLKYIVLIAIILGGTLEGLQQICTTYRNMDFYDALANTLGAFFGAYIVKKHINKNKV